MRLLPLATALAPLLQAVSARPTEACTSASAQEPVSKPLPRLMPYRLQRPKPQWPFLGPSPVAATPVTLVTSAQVPSARLADFGRDFDRHPLKVHLHGDSLPAEVAVLADVHAAANRMFVLLENNGIIQRGPTLPGDAANATAGANDGARCGNLPQSALGAFRWRNPYVWSYGSNVLVSLGDRINKGPFNLVTDCFFRDLSVQAKAAGGRVVLQWGNHEAQTAAAWDNSKTRGPGGLLWELWGYGIDPDKFFASDGWFGKTVRNSPIVTQLEEAVVMVHGGICPSNDSLDEELETLRREMNKDGFRAGPLQRENSLVRCRIHRGRKGEVTKGPVTEVIYAHDPEHDPRGLPFCKNVTAPSQKPFVVCRSDVGLTPYINYSLGFLEKYQRQEAGFARQICNELGACSTLNATAPSPPPTPPFGAAAPPGRSARPLTNIPFGNPGRGPHRGIDRNNTAHPTIDVVRNATGALFVLPDVQGALFSTRAFLTRLGLVADGALLDPPMWTGSDSVVVVPGNLVGAGYLNLATMRFFQALEPQAQAAGGGVYALLGATEVDFLTDPNNDATWAGGGMATEIVGQNIWPETFASLDNPLYRWMHERPFGLRIFDLLVLPGGQTSNRGWEDLAEDLDEALQEDGFGAELIAGDNSVTKKTGFAGRDGRQGPLLAADAGVTSIIHGLDFSMEPFDDIKAYGEKDGVHSLFNVATRLNPALGKGHGKILRVRKQGERLVFDAFGPDGKHQRVARNPYRAHLAV